MKTKNDLLNTIDGFIEKARVRGHKGLFATRIPPYYVQPKGNQKGYWVPKDKSEKLDWETIQKIRDEGSAVDWEVMKDSDVEVFPPESGERPHKHLYVSQSHPVSLEHTRPKHKAAHNEEVGSYKESYSKLFDPNDPSRLHVHEGAEKPHQVTKPHKAELQTSHNDEVDQYEKEYYDIDKEPKIWLDKFNVRTKQEKFPQASDGTAMVYSSDHPVFKTMKPIKTFEKNDVSYVLVHDKYYKFDKARDALDFIKSIFELRYDRTKLKKGLDDFLSKQILKDGPSSQPVSVCILSKYKSGNNEVLLAGDKGNYTVEVNGSNKLSTDNLQEAIIKYYSAIGNIIKAHEGNKGMALELFGDQVVSSNRKIMPLLSALGEEKAMKMIKSMDYSGIEHFFKDGISVNLFGNNIKLIDKHKPNTIMIKSLSNGKIEAFIND